LTGQGAQSSFRELQLPVVEQSATKRLKSLRLKALFGSRHWSPKPKDEHWRMTSAQAKGPLHMDAEPEKVLHP